MSKQTKEPKRYICLNCGFKSSRHKTLSLPGIGFAICFKCRESVKETDEWLKWHYDQMEEWRKSIASRRLKAIESTE